MAVTETPPETVEAVADSAPASAPHWQPGGLAGVLGSGDHKVIGRLYIGGALLFGTVVLALSLLFGVEAIDPPTLEVFSADTVFQMWTLGRIGQVFLLALPLVIGLAMVVVPLQVGSRSIAFPRAAAASFWGWLVGATLLVASYAMNGGPGGGSKEGVNLWIASLGLLVVATVLAAVCLATTVIALRTPGMTVARTPLFAWSVLVASVLWLLTLPVLGGLLVLLYVDHRHGGSSFGGNAQLFGRITWVLRNPQIYVVAIPVLGFAADVLATTARTRIAPRSVALGAIGAFGVLGFGAFLAAPDGASYESWLFIGMSLLAALPVLAILGLAGDLFRRGTLRLTAGSIYAVTALVLLLIGVAAGALGSIPALEANGTIYDLGVSHAVLLATLTAALGGIHWWATKIGRQSANESLGRLVPALLLLGTLAAVVPDLISGIAGENGELAPDWSGGIEGLNIVVPIGVGLIAIALLVAVVSFLPLLRSSTDEVPADPWEGQTLEWLAPSPPPLANFVDDLPVVASAEPLTDQREEK